MGRFWFGLGILLLILALGFFVHFHADSANTEIAEALELAAEKVLQNDITAAHQFAREAHAAWKENWQSTAAFADHAPMDEIDSLFAVLDLYQKTGRHEDFAAYCARTAMLIRAIGEGQTFNWWNLL